MNDTYLAIDLGASSGRTMAGYIENDQLKLREINRFWNGAIPLHNTLHWDFLHLYRHLREGISIARAQTPIRSLAVDTWGVDFGLLNPQGGLIQNPVHYRDRRTNGMFKALFEKLPREKIFEQTGIQFMEINTLYQLYALSLQQDTAYQQAETLLFSPDLLTYWLTGEKIAERTIASTSQCYNPTRATWADELLDIVNIRRDFFGELTTPAPWLAAQTASRLSPVPDMIRHAPLPLRPNNQTRGPPSSAPAPGHFLAANWTNPLSTMPFSPIISPTKSESVTPFVS